MSTIALIIALFSDCNGMTIGQAKTLATDIVAHTASYTDAADELALALSDVCTGVDFTKTAESLINEISE